MFVKNAGKCIPVAVLSLLLSVPAVFAHNSLLYPDKTTAVAGETVEVVATISEPLGVADLPFYSSEKIGYNYGPLKLAAFKGDKVTAIDASYFDIRNGAKKRYTHEEVEAAFLREKEAKPDDPAYSVMSRVFNANIGTYTIESEGTVAFAAASSYGSETVVKSFMKTFVNLTGDGESTKARASYFAFDGLELRPADDLGAVKSGGTVRVEALLNGKPQSGVVVYSGHKDLEESKRLSPVLEYSEKPDPIQYAGVTDINGIVELKLPEVPAGAKELKDVYLFTDGHLTVEKVRYRATISFTLSR